MTPERETKFKRVAKNRQTNLTVILENVHDPHNIGAVLRTCDSVGVHEIFVLYTDPGLDRDHLEIGTTSSSGARKWVDVHFYTNVLACFEHVRKDYEKILCTHLAQDAVLLHDLDLTQSIALLFGNEHAGVSEEALRFSDGNYVIPQVGMVESLNISVACAVSLYEAFRQRKECGFYDDNPVLSALQQQALFDIYVERHETRFKQKRVKRRD